MLAVHLLSVKNYLIIYSRSHDMMPSGLSINFTEIMWKSIVKKQYPDPLDYQRFMGNFSSVVGGSTCIVIFLGVHAIRILGWRVGALATPAGKRVGRARVCDAVFFSCAHNHFVFHSAPLSPSSSSNSNGCPCNSIFFQHPRWIG